MDLLRQEGSSRKIVGKVAYVVLVGKRAASLIWGGPTFGGGRGEIRKKRGGGGEKRQIECTEGEKLSMRKKKLSARQVEGLYCTDAGASGLRKEESFIVSWGIPLTPANRGGKKQRQRMGKKKGTLFFRKGSQGVSVQGGSVRNDIS